MEILKPLLLFYAGIVLVNTLFMSSLWIMNRNSLYMWGAILWIGTFVNFALQGVFDTGTPQIIAAFSTYYVCSLILAKILGQTNGIPPKYTLYNGVLFFSIIASIALYTNDFGFTYTSIPIAIAVATPMIHSAIAHFWFTKNRTMENVFAGLLIFNGLHFLDFPFLRPIPDFAILGFSVAFGLMILMSIYLPIYTFKSLSDSTAKSLEEEIQNKIESENYLHFNMERAQALVKNKNEFLAKFSREFRNPLNGIIGTTQLLLLNNLDPETKDLITIIDQSSDELMTLVHEVEDYSRLQTCDTEINYSNFSIGKSVSSVIDMFTSRANQKGIRLALEIHGNVPNIVRSDEDRLKQILINLVSNAFKHTHKGSVTVTVSMDMPGKLLFQVKDTGVGIPFSKQVQIFNTFTQVDSTTLTHPPRFDLATARDLVTQLGGEIECSSDPGIGTVFSFTLNTHLATVFANEETATQLARSSPLEHIPTLLLSDDEYACTAAADSLKRLGLNPEIRYLSESPDEDLIQKDYRLIFVYLSRNPDECIKSIKKALNKLNSSTLVVACLLRATESQVTLLLQSGVNQILSLPLVDNEVLELIEPLLDSSAETGQAAA
ncbi:MAG: HAMP domain-containing histidine kinase [Gammaproteobacteria bacterium]|nr:HAMP domain-containing histidine kinase [Gammaproteobacteria bacterium]